MTIRLFLLGLTLALAACDGGKPDTDTADPSTGGTDTADPDPGVDADGDGFEDDVDCNDADPTVHPDAAEECDGVDNNCDGQIDEGLQTTWYADDDGDGYGDDDEAITSCTQPSGAVAEGGDCDDDDERTNPGAEEVCDDANADEDCDGVADNDDDSATGLLTWYADSDGDGYGSPDDTIEACDAEPGYISNDGDCDDTVEGPSCWSGTWTGDIDVDLTIAELSTTDTCSGTVSLPIDTDASPMIDGTGSCTSSLLGSVSFTITGNIDADGSITDGVASAASFFPLDWSGTITSTELNGTGKGRDTSTGFTVTYALTMYATP